MCKNITYMSCLLKNYRTSTLVLATVLCVGCGRGQESTLEGLVTLDGSPVTRGRITFVPSESGAGAFASINSDGSYQAHTGSLNGLESGEYSIAIQSRENSIPDPKGGPPLPGKLITPKKYSRSNTSGLTISITPGSNQVNFELETDPLETTTKPLPSKRRRRSR